MENNEKQTLMQKLSTKLKSKFYNFKTIIKEKAVKRAFALTLAAAIAVAPITLSACSNNNVNPDSGTNPPIVNTNPGNGTNPGDNSNPGNGTTPGDEQQSQYSQLIQYVLNTEYYNNLLASAEQLESLYDSPFFDPHPYGFFKDEGYDTALIKQGELSCGTRSYVLNSEPNNLYIATYVETKAATPYYTEYILKYKLTDQEFEDYDMLHEHPYLQSVFLNDVVSTLKTPTIVSKIRCTVETHNALRQMFENINSVSKKLLNTNWCEDFILKSINFEDNTFEVMLFPGTEKYRTVTFVADFEVSGGGFFLRVNEDNAFKNIGDWPITCNFPKGITDASQLDTSTLSKFAKYYNNQTHRYAYKLAAFITEK